MSFPLGAYCSSCCFHKKKCKKCSLALEAILKQRASASTPDETIPGELNSTSVENLSFILHFTSKKSGFGRARLVLKRDLQPNSAVFSRMKRQNPGKIKQKAPKPSPHAVRVMTECGLLDGVQVRSQPYHHVDFHDSPIKCTSLGHMGCRIRKQHVKTTGSSRRSFWRAARRNWSPDTRVVSI